MAHRETEDLIKRVQRLGYTVERGSGGHAKVHDPEGKYIYTMPLTPSDSRSMKNVIAGLQRAGVPVRQSSKKRKGYLGERQARTLKNRVEGFISSNRATQAEIARYAVKAGEEKGIRTFKTPESAAHSISRLREGHSVTKWAGDAIGAGLNMLETPERPAPTPEPERAIPDIVLADGGEIHFKTQADYRALQEDWDIAFDSLERTLRLFRAAVRRTFENGKEQ